MGRLEVLLVGLDGLHEKVQTVPLHLPALPVEVESHQAVVVVVVAVVVAVAVVMAAAVVVAVW